MGRLVIATCRPRPGRERDLREILRRHLPVLRGEGIVTGRAPVVMRAEDGTVVEILELACDQWLDRAARSAPVRALWERLQAACDCINLRGAPDPRPPLPGTGPLGP